MVFDQRPHPLRSFGERKTLFSHASVLLRIPRKRFAQTASTSRNLRNIGDEFAFHESFVIAGFEYRTAIGCCTNCRRDTTFINYKAIKQQTKETNVNSMIILKVLRWVYFTNTNQSNAHIILSLIENQFVQKKV